LITGGALGRDPRSTTFHLWSRNMFTHVEEARYISGYRVWVRFNDGDSGEVDLAEDLWGPVFEPLKDQEKFKDFDVRYHTIAWKNGADLAPEYLKEKLAEQSAAQRTGSSFASAGR
jgi:hypothetical protein